MCRPDGQTVSRWAATLARWRTGTPRTSRSPCSSPMTTGGCRSAQGRRRSWIRSPRIRSPHHGPQSRRCFSFSGHEKRQAPSLPSFEAVCTFSALARPFSLRLVSPRSALPLRLLALPAWGRGDPESGIRNRGQEMNFCERHYPGFRIGNFPVREGHGKGIRNRGSGIAGIGVRK